MTPENMHESFLKVLEEHDMTPEKYHEFFLKYLESVDNFVEVVIGR